MEKVNSGDFYTLDEDTAERRVPTCTFCGIDATCDHTKSNCTSYKCTYTKYPKYPRGWRPAFKSSGGAKQDVALPCINSREGTDSTPLHKTYDINGARDKLSLYCKPRAWLYKPNDYLNPGQTKIKRCKDHNWAKKKSTEYFSYVHEARKQFKDLGKVCHMLEFDCTSATNPTRIEDQEEENKTKCVCPLEKAKKRVMNMSGQLMDPKHLQDFGQTITKCACPPECHEELGYRKHPRDINEGKICHLNDPTWKGIPVDWSDYDTVPLFPATKNARYIQVPQGPFDWIDRRRRFPEYPKSIPLSSIPKNNLQTHPDIVGNAGSVIRSVRGNHRVAKRLNFGHDPQYHTYTQFW